MPEQKGRAFRSSRGWGVSCSSLACGTKLKLESAVESTVAPSVSVDGLVAMRVEGRAKEILRAAGARWDRDARKYRLALTNMEEAARSIEAGRLLGLEGVEALEAAYAPMMKAATANVEAATARAVAVGAYPFQVEGVRWLAGRDRALLADDMGLGKTLQLLVSLPEGARAMVVAPKSLALNWCREAAKWRPDLTATRVAKWQGIRAPQAGEILVTHYECLRAHAGKVARGNAPAVDWSGIVLIADEAHRAKNRDALLTKAFRAVAEEAATVWIATGTPLTGRPTDLWGTLESGRLGSLAFGHFGAFCGAFNAHKGQYGMVWGAPDPAVVPGALARVMLRRTKAEALPGLPPKTYVDLTVEIPKKGISRELDRIERENAGLLEAGELPPFEDMSKARALLAESRIPALMEWCDDRKDAGPVVVFSAHRAPVDALAEREGWAVITGDTSAEDRQHIVETFQAGELHGIGLTIGAGREGLTLTAADTLLFVDLDWTPAMNAQAEDRICRIGQESSTVTIVTMVSDHPVDVRIGELIRRKMGLINATVEAAKNAAPLERPDLGTYEPAVQEASIWTLETEAEMLARMEAARASRDQAAQRRIVEEARSKAQRVVARRGLDRDRTFTPEQVEAMESALRDLSSACDGARTVDGMGFNKIDTAYGKWTAIIGLDDPSAQTLTFEILRKYVRQIPADTYQAIYG